MEKKENKVLSVSVSAELYELFMTYVKANAQNNQSFALRQAIELLLKQKPENKTS